MKIRQLLESDIDQISKLDVRFSSPWSRYLYRERIKMFPDLSYGLFDNNNLVGFVLGKEMSGPDDIYISRVVVDRKHEGKGYGKKLMNTILSKEKKRFFSDVRESNVRSINLHKSVGFFPLDVEHFYSDDERGIKFLKYQR